MQQNKLEIIISHKATTILVFISNLCLLIYTSYYFAGNLLLLLVTSPFTLLFCSRSSASKASLSGFGDCTGITMLLLLLFPIIFYLVSMVLIFFKKKNKKISAIVILLVNAILTFYLFTDVLANVLSV
jgi:hypothetical protein